MTNNLNILINDGRQGRFHVPQTHLRNPFCFIWSALLRFRSEHLWWWWSTMKLPGKTHRSEIITLFDLLKYRLWRKCADQYCLQSGLQRSPNLNQSCSCVVESDLIYAQSSAEFFLRVLLFWWPLKQPASESQPGSSAVDQDSSLINVIHLIVIGTHFSNEKQSEQRSDLPY